MGIGALHSPVPRLHSGGNAFLLRRIASRSSRLPRYLRCDERERTPAAAKNAVAAGNGYMPVATRKRLDSIATHRVVSSDGAKRLISAHQLPTTDSGHTTIIGW